MSTRFVSVDSDQHHQEQELSASVEGILGCIEVGLAHLSPEQRQLYDTDAEPNLLLQAATKTPPRPGSGSKQPG